MSAIKGLLRTSPWRAASSSSSGGGGGGGGATANGNTEKLKRQSPVDINTDKNTHNKNANRDRLA